MSNRPKVLPPSYTTLKFNPTPNKQIITRQNFFERNIWTLIGHILNQKKFS